MNSQRIKINETSFGSKVYNSLLIGSQALRIGLEGIGLGLGRVPVDFDLLAREEEVHKAIEVGLYPIRVTGDKLLYKAPDGKMVEIEIARPGTSASQYLDWAESKAMVQTEIYGVSVDVAPLGMLFSLKRAHRHSPRAFHKHIKDYNRLRVMFNGHDTFALITALRYKETAEREKLKTPSLQKTATDFFDDKVSNRTFIHDQIHEVMAFEARPMFEKIKVDPNLVTCSKEKFFALTPEQRDHCVQEEAYVIALERAIIPMLWEGEKIAQPIEAYKWALMRICTTLCSGWFREYAVENYGNLMLRYNWTYVDKFLIAVETGKIERIK